MDARKRKRLEAAGWKIGSVKDFLGLSEEEAALVELKRSLADALRQSRTRRGLSQTDLAKRMMKSSQSRVAKLEAGDTYGSEMARERYVRIPIEDPV